MAKKIRNWKVVAEVGDVKVAIDVLKNQQYLHYTGPFNIQSSYSKRQYDAWSYGMQFSLEEIMASWKILVPDTDEELKNEKVRQMVKDSNCSRLTYDKIDNMTTREIWEHISGHLSDDQMYRMIKLYYSEKVYKEK